MVVEMVSCVEARWYYLMEYFALEENPWKSMMLFDEIVDAKSTP